MAAQVKPVKEDIEWGYFCCSKIAHSETLSILHSTEKQPESL